MISSHASSGAGAGVFSGPALPDDDRTYAIVGIPAGRSSPLAGDRPHRRDRTGAAWSVRSGSSSPTLPTSCERRSRRSPARSRPSSWERKECRRIATASSVSPAGTPTVLAGSSGRCSSFTCPDRQETLRLEPLAVRPLLEEAAAMLDAPEGVAVEVDYPPELAVLAQRDLQLRSSPTWPRTQPDTPTRPRCGSPRRRPTNGTPSSIEVTRYWDGYPPCGRRRTDL